MKPTRYMPESLVAAICLSAVLAGGIVRGERAVRTGDEWLFDVAGYDPRAR